MAVLFRKNIDQSSYVIFVALLKDLSGVLGRNLYVFVFFEANLNVMFEGFSIYCYVSYLFV